MKSLRIYHRNGEWVLMEREWHGGPDPPIRTFIRDLTLDEAIELYQSGQAEDADGDVRDAIRNPLEEMARAAQDGKHDDAGA